MSGSDAGCAGTHVGEVQVLPYTVFGGVTAVATFGPYLFSAIGVDWTIGSGTASLVLASPGGPTDHAELYGVCFGGAGWELITFEVRP